MPDYTKRTAAPPANAIATMLVTKTTVRMTRCSTELPALDVLVRLHRAHSFGGSCHGTLVPLPSLGGRFGVPVLSYEGKEDVRSV